MGECADAPPSDLAPGAARRRLFAGLTLWLAAAALALAAQYLLTPLRRGRDGLALYLVAALLGAVAALLLDRRDAPAENAFAPPPPRGTARPAWQLWVAGTASVALTAGWFLAQHFELERTTLWLWLASLVATACAFALGAPRRSAGTRRPPRWEVAALGAILLLALALRLPALASIPLEVHGDEAWCGLEARSILDGSVRYLFGVGWFNLPYLGFALYVPFLWLFGDDLFGLRMASVFHGTLSVLLLHLVARELFRPSVGLLAAFLLAVSQWHIHFSRSGIDYIQAGSVSLALFWFLLHGIRRGRPLSFLLAGYMAALCFDVYYAARLTPLLAVAYLLHRSAAERGFWRAQASNLEMAELGALLFAMPMLFFFAQFPDSLMARTEGVWIFTAENREHAMQALETQSFAQAMGGQLLRSIGAFNYFGETSLQHGQRGPLLDFWTGAFFVLGTAAFSLRLRRSATFLIGLWFWATLFLGGVFTVDALFSPRLSAVLPVLLVFPALFLDLGGDALRRAFGRTGAGLGLAALAVFAGLTLRANVHDYFTAHAAAQQETFYTALARHVAAVNGDYRVYLFGDGETSLQFSTALFLVPHADGADVGARMLPLPLPHIPAAKGVEFLVAVRAPRAEERLELIRQAYPNGQRGVVANRVGFVHLYSYRVEHADLVAANPAAEFDAGPLTGAAETVALPARRDAAAPPAVAAGPGPAGGDWEVVAADPGAALPPFALPSLQEPVDVAVAPGGAVYLLDRGSRQVHAFDVAGRHRWTIRARAGTGGWPDPRAVAAAADGSVLVLDAQLGRVYRFAADGRFAAVRAVVDAYSPSGLSSGPNGEVLIADTGASRLVRWPDLTSDAVQQTPGPPAAASPLAQPATVAVAADGRIFVADAEYQALVILDRELRALARWPLPPFDPAHAAHVVARGERVLISDPEAGRIAVHDRAGRRLGELGAGELVRPVGMALTASGDLLVADPGATALLKLRVMSDE